MLSMRRHAHNPQFASPGGLRKRIVHSFLAVCIEGEEQPHSGKLRSRNERNQSEEGCSEAAGGRGRKFC